MQSLGAGRSTCGNQAREGLAQLCEESGHALDCLIIILEAAAQDVWPSRKAAPIGCCFVAVASLTLTYTGRSDLVLILKSTVASEGPLPLHNVPAG